MKIDVYPYPRQSRFIRSRARFTAFVAGIGSGKTWAGAVKIGEHVGQRRCRGIVTAPTYRMLLDATLNTFMALWEPAIVFSKSDMKATFKHNGSEALFRSADNPDRLRGPNITWWWGDEAGLYTEEVWQIMIGRLREGPGAQGWLTTTPKGRNWLYRLFGEQPRADYELIRAMTQDNVHLDPAFVASLEEAYTGQFAAQELGGEFVSFEGLVYDEFSRRVHVVERSGPWKQVIAGCDEGYTNPAVILVVGIDGDGREHVLEEFYQRRVLQGAVVAEAQRLRQAHGISAFYVDPSAAGLIAEMRASKLPVTEAVNAVMPGIQAVKARLAVAGDGRTRLTVSAACVNTIAEFEGYVWKDGAKKEEPVKTNDHALDSLRYLSNRKKPVSRRLVTW